MAAGTHRTGPEGGLVAYEKTPIIAPSYSLNQTEQNAIIESLLSRPASDSAIANTLIALEDFETILKVYNHEEDNYKNMTPLAHHNEWSVATKHSLAKREIAKLLKFKIPQKTNMSIMEILNLPTETYRTLVNSCIEIAVETNDTVEDIVASLEDEMK